MAGLLDGFLPWAFSTGNTIKRNVRGLLTDPVSFGGSLMQDLQTQNQQRSQDFNTLFQPGVFTSPQDKQQAMGRAAQEAVNYAAPTVWHGSPHKFDKFDSSKIGTGEGAQAYGHGLYLADQPGVAESYRAAGNSAPVGVNQSTVAAVRNWMQEAADAGLSGPEASKWAKQKLHERGMSTSSSQVRQTMYDAMNNFDDILAGKYGHLYKVDLPDSAVAKMLDWDKPLSQQSKAVKDAINKLDDRFRPQDAAEWENVLGERLYRRMENALGRGQGTGAEPAASALLRQQGIPGIRYLDGGSRGAGTGTRNYVVFPGGEGMLRILERNGQGLLGQ